MVETNIKNLKSATKNNLGQIINKQDIHRFISIFYDSVFADPILTELFTKTVKHRAEDHIQRVADFWSSLILNTDDYKNPLFGEKHLGLRTKVINENKSVIMMNGHPLSEKVTEKHFSRWLELFSIAAHTVFTEEIASIFINKANTIANNLRYCVI